MNTQDNISKELADGIAAYKRTWKRFDNLWVSAQVGSAPSQRQTGVFSAGECQPTITTLEGRRYAVRDLGSLRVEPGGPPQDAPNPAARFFITVAGGSVTVRHSDTLIQTAKVVGGWPVASRLADNIARKLRSEFPDVLQTHIGFVARDY